MILHATYMQSSSCVEQEANILRGKEQSGVEGSCNKRGRREEPEDHEALIWKPAIVVALQLMQ